MSCVFFIGKNYEKDKGVSFIRKGLFFRFKTILMSGFGGFL